MLLTIRFYVLFHGNQVLATGTVHRNPMLLLVVVSQWHNQLVFRCYDFASGETREAERPDYGTDAELIRELKVTQVVEHVGSMGITLLRSIKMDAAVETTVTVPSTISIR